MSATDHRPVHAVMIPWIIALVALFGVNALAPVRLRSTNSDSPEEIGLSQLADDAQTPRRISNPLLYLAPAPSDGFEFPNPSSLLPCIETHRNVPVVRSLEGAVQGRAPPVRSFC